MAVKNYYAILGVSPAETPSGIRAAYRDAVRRTHPDYAGPRSVAEFQEIVEAHSVLSDPQQRRQYDQTLERYEQDRIRPRLGLWHDLEPASLFEDAFAVHPSFDALAERLLRNFTGLAVPKAEKPEALSVEVILSREEALRGGVLAIGLPVHNICRACGGSGSNWPFLCRTCGGEGLVFRVQPVRIRIPQELRLGLVPEMSLEALGIGNLFLRVRVRVSNS